MPVYAVRGSAGAGGGGGGMRHLPEAMSSGVSSSSVLNVFERDSVGSWPGGKVNFVAVVVAVDVSVGVLGRR